VSRSWTESAPRIYLRGGAHGAKCWSTRISEIVRRIGGVVVIKDADMLDAARGRGSSLGSAVPPPSRRFARGVHGRSLASGYVG
jgi:hypothetical protein